MNKADGATGTSTAQRKDSTSSVASSNTGSRTGGSRYQSRYTSKQTPDKKVEPAKEEDEEEEEESSEEEETTESESEEESEEEPAPPVKKSSDVARTTSRMDKTDIGPLLARSANARDRGESVSSNSTSYSTRRRQAEEPTSPTATSSVNSYRRNRVTSPPAREVETSSRYGTSSGSGATSSSTTGAGSSRLATYPYCLLLLFIIKLIDISIKGAILRNIIFH